MTIRPLRNNRWGCVFYVVRAEQQLERGSLWPFARLRNGSYNITVFLCGPCRDYITRFPEFTSTDSKPLRGGKSNISWSKV
jgi:hypothetical protein